MVNMGYGCTNVCHVVTHIGEACEDGWLYFGDFCYTATEPRRDWLTSRDLCRDMGAELASYHTREELVSIGGVVVDDVARKWSGYHRRIIELGGFI